MAFRVGIDVGGTFTDFVLMDASGRSRIAKVLSTPDDPSLAVVAGLEELAAAETLSVSDFFRAIDLIVHGTTVTTNAILTGRWCKTGLITTRGFRDALEMRRGIREAQYDNKFRAPTPIVPRHRRLPATERIDHAGAVVTPIDLADIDAAAAAFAREGVEAVAVCFMHAYANDAHERVAARRLRERMPGAYISASSEILPQVRFYERTSTTVLNAAVGPLLARYLESLMRRLADARFGGVLLVMQSNGGVAAPRTAIARAATTLLSGPAAGPLAGLALMAPHGEDRCITIDMGGTSFEASLCRGGAPAVTTSATVNRFALALPAMDIKTIGAGGGSIAWIDEGGLLRMGPASAGAKPGPACYGLGGTEPTCSDANLILGFLAADFFAGGRIKLDVEAARRAIRDKIASRLGLDLAAAAAGMYRVINVNMASAIREISVQRGHDPRDFPLISAGGAAPIHAALIARELGIARILVPRDASVFCAGGMLRTDLKHDHVRSYAVGFSTEAIDGARFHALFRDMEAEGRRTLADEGIPPARQRLRYDLDLRYRGQYHEVRIEDIPLAEIATLDLAAIAARFHRAHDRLYGYSLSETGTPIDLVNLRLAATGVTAKAALAEEPRRGADAGGALKGRRAAYLPDDRRFVEMPVFDGDRLRHGNALAGPALVETAVTTIFVPPGYDLAVDKLGTCVLSERRSA
jgi:N-methylhydantoinase A